MDKNLKKLQNQVNSLTKPSFKESQTFQNTFLVKILEVFELDHTVLPGDESIPNPPPSWYSRPPSKDIYYHWEAIQPNSFPNKWVGSSNKYDKKSLATYPPERGAKYATFHRGDLVNLRLCATGNIIVGPAANDSKNEINYYDEINDNYGWIKGRRAEFYPPTSSQQYINNPDYDVNIPNSQRYMPNPNYSDQSEPQKIIVNPNYDSQVPGSQQYILNPDYDMSIEEYKPVNDTRTNAKVRILIRQYYDYQTDHNYEYYRELIFSPQGNLIEIHNVVKVDGFETTLHI